MTALPDTALHSPLQGHEYSILCEAEIEKPLQYEFVDYRRPTYGGVRRDGVEVSVIEKVRQTTDVISPIVAWILVDRQQAAYVVPIDEGDQLLTEEHVGGHSCTVHECNAFETVSIVDRVPE
jgi:hypothetical protein